MLHFALSLNGAIHSPLSRQIRQKQIFFLDETTSYANGTRFITQRVAFYCYFFDSLFMSPRSLLIFGLRGTLLERLSVDETPTTLYRKPSFTFAKYNVWLRPGVTRALDRLRKHFDLAIWSATPARNTVPVATDAFPNHKFLFVWHRGQTIKDKIRRQLSACSERSDAHAVLKNLNRVYTDFPMCNPKNTVMIDDAIFKCRAHSGNVLLIPTYNIYDVMNEGEKVETQEDIKGKPSAKNGEKNMDSDQGNPNDASDASMKCVALCQFLEQNLLDCSDVRTKLPQKLFF